MSDWWERAYPGGPMVGPAFIRPLYPPDAAKKGKKASGDGKDVEAIKRAVSRGGHWPWQQFDRTFSNGFSHGRTGNVSENGLAGVQRQNGIDASGWMGEQTYNLIRSARIPEGLPHAEEPLLDATAIRLLEEYRDAFQTSTRHRLSDHFIVEEFDCHDGTKVSSREYDGLEALCAVFLEPLHGKFGSVHVNSGFRTQTYNASIGGASNSFHIYTAHDGDDQAADVTCGKGTPADWHAFLNNIRQNKRGGNGGLGLYSTFVHVDMRDYPSSWKG